MYLFFTQFCNVLFLFYYFDFNSNFRSELMIKPIWMSQIRYISTDLQFLCFSYLYEFIMNRPFIILRRTVPLNTGSKLVKLYRYHI